MNYSAKRKANKVLVKLQEKQRAEIDKAQKAKREASTHEEKLLIEAKSRSNIDKLVKEYHNPKRQKKANKIVDLKSKKEVENAIKLAAKGK